MPTFNRKYKDVNLSFAKHPVTKDVATLLDDNAVKESVKNIVLTNFEERPFQPNLGCNILATLFENFDPITEERIKDYIVNALETNEPRASVQKVEVEAYEDRNALRVGITFSITNSLEPVKVEVFLERVR